MNTNEFGKTFLERKEYVYQYMNKKFDFDETVERLFLLLKPIPLEMNSPLTDEVMMNLLNVEHIEDLKSALIETLYLLNGYELRNFKDIKKHLEYKKLDLLGQLSLLKRELSKIDGHEYRPNLQEWIEDLKLDAEKIAEVYLSSIQLLEEWNKKESR